jgi:hypothetical protein
VTTHIVAMDYTEHAWTCRLCGAGGIANSYVGGADAAVKHYQEKHDAAVVYELGSTPEQIDDAVDAWHEGAGLGMELHEYLGWTEEEYSAWVSDPKKIRPLRIWPS